MPITPPRNQPFTCVICLDVVELDRWTWTPAQSVPPVCNRCAEGWGKAVGGYGDLNPDRRLLRRVSALAECLHSKAYCISKGVAHGTP